MILGSSPSTVSAPPGQSSNSPHTTAFRSSSTMCGRMTEAPLSSTLNTSGSSSSHRPQEMQRPVSTLTLMGITYSRKVHIDNALSLC